MFDRNTAKPCSSIHVLSGAAVAVTAEVSNWDRDQILRGPPRSQSFPSWLSAEKIRGVLIFRKNHALIGDEPGC